MDTASRQVSVIVPVYNTEKYLRRCLESLVHQTLKDLEILVVDDGSTDRQVHGIWESGSALGIM